MRHRRTRVVPPIGIILSGLILVVGVAFSTIPAASLAGAERREGREVAARRVDEVHRAVTAATEHAAGILTSTAAALGSQHHITTDSFDALVEPLAIGSREVASAYAFVVPARPDHVAAVQAEWRDRSTPTLTLRPSPSATHGEHLFVVLRHAFDDSPDRLGLDLAAAPEPTDATRLARTTGRMAVSAPYVLLRDRMRPIRNQHLGFVLVAPVTGSGDAPDAGAFRGWLMVSLRPKAFLSAVVPASVADRLDVELVDSTTPDAPVLLASLTSGASVARSQARAATLRVGDRTWTITTAPTHGLLSVTLTSLPLTAAISGSVISALVSLLILVLFSARQRAVARVRQATAVLRRDIERRKVVEAELEAALVVRNQFVSGVSHELRTPLTSILGYTEALADGDAGSLGDDQTRLLSVVDRNAHRLLVLVEDLLLLSRLDARGFRGSPEALSVDALVANALDLVAPSFRSRDLRLDIDGAGGVTVLGDRGQLERALANLLSNAIKYTPDGGSVRLEVAAHDGHAWIAVSDTGAGIAAEEQPFVFEPFFRSKAAQRSSIPGTGLGLAIVRTVVEAHGGHVSLRSTVGEGTTVVVALPLASVDAPALV